MATPNEAAVEKAREDLKKRVLAYCRGASELELKQLDKDAAYTQLLTQIGLLTNLSTHLLNASDVQAVADALSAEFKPARDAIEKVFEQYQDIVTHVDKAIATLNKLGNFEYLKGLQISESLNTIAKDSESLKQSYNALLAAYDRLVPPAPGAGGIEVFEQQCSAIRAKKPAADKLLEDIALAARHLADAGSAMVTLVKKSAVRAYIAEHRTASMEMVEYINKDVKDLIEFVGGKIDGKAGPFQWILPFVDLFREAAYLLADELVKSAAVEDYLKHHTAEETFDEFTKNPLLMAEHLNEVARRNLDAALTLLGALGKRQPKIWSLVMKVVKEAFDAYLKHRIKLAKDAIAGLMSGPAKPSPDTLQEAVTKALGEIWSELEKEVIEELEDPEFWRKVLMAKAEGKLDVEWVLDHLGELMIKPIVDQIIKVLPVTPAQIITGADLAQAISLGEDMIPEAYRVSGPSGSAR